MLARTLSSSSSFSFLAIPRAPSARHIVSYADHFINGAWVPAGSGASIDVTDSNTGEVFARAPAGNPDEMDSAIEAAAAAFPSWSLDTTLEERIDAVERIAAAFTERQDAVGEALERELGAPHFFAKRIQANMLPLHLRVAVEEARTFDWEVEVPAAPPGSKAPSRTATLVRKEPIGVVGAITPWNWPLNQLGCKLAPALLSGCTMVIKPSEVTPVNAVLLAEAVHAAALPPGVLNVVWGTGPGVGERLATHPLVDMVSFTGSTPVGKKLHALGATTVKRVRTELGGKSAAVVLDDATPSQIKRVATNVIGNTGQSCDALSRLVVPRSRLKEAEAIAKEAFEGTQVVDATDRGEPGAKPRLGDIGPLASQAQHDKVRGFIEAGLAEGAKLVAGGLEPPPGVPAGGFFVRPTVFSEVTNDMTIAQEEIFGPVLSIIAYDTEEEAIRIANDTVYGLSNAVVSADEDRAMAVARQLRSGQVKVNTTDPNPRAPFGGFKQSGDGREWGAYAFDDFVQIKAYNRPAPAE